METHTSEASEVRNLRSNINILTRGGPVTVNIYQSTNPVLLKGMELPAEASYVFANPTDESHHYVNSPVSIELFWGENGEEAQDISLGRFELRDIFPAFAAGSKKIDIRLAVDAAQLLSISLLDPPAGRYRNIGFIDISKLEPPEKIEPTPKLSPAEANKLAYQQVIDLWQNNKPRKTGHPRHGKDISQGITISFEEALHGTRKDIEALSTEKCPTCSGRGVAHGKGPTHCADCGGTGWKKEEVQTDKGPQWHAETCPRCGGDGFIIADPCPNCRGRGWVKATRPLTLQIPACVDQDAEICILHQGEPGRYGGASGQLRIVVDIVKHPLFTRVSRDIFIELPVSTKLAREGGCLRVPDIEKGKFVPLNLPAGTKSGMAFRVFEGNDYSLTAWIETYNPAMLFALLPVRQRLQMIREWLGNVDYELPLDSTTTGQTLSINGSGATQGMIRSTKQAEFYTRRGTLYADRQNRQHAMDDFSRAIELDPECASAYDKRSVLSLTQGNTEKALADLNKALELEPNNSEFYHHRGLLYDYQQDPAQALADYNKALELDPTQAEVYESRGRAHLLLKNLEAGLSDYSKVLELDPTNAASYYQRGIVYSALKDLPKALADFNKALELAPDNEAVFADRIMVYVSLNDWEHALGDTNKFMEKHPDSARAYNNRGYIHLHQNNYASAVDDYNKALELDPKLDIAYSYRGQAYLKQGSYEQAADDFKEALLLHPEDASLHLWLGQAYQGCERKWKAVNAFQKVLEISQDQELCKEAQKHLGELDVK